MMRPLCIAAASLVALLWLAPAAEAETIVYRAFLSGPNEDPPVDSPGTGFALLTFDLSANTMRLRVTFRDLLGTTTMAHIHAPTAVPFAGNVGVATQLPSFAGFPTGVTSGTYDRTFDLGLTSTYSANFLNNFGGGTADGAAAALKAAVAGGRAYLNIHTTFSPPGEIRGFFVPIPEPSSVVLAGLGVSGVAVALARGRRRPETGPRA